MRVFVLLFNAGTDNEGIHTLRKGDRNIVLMFEDEDDAIRYGLMLEAQDLPNPVVEVFDEREIEAFCESADYDFQMIPKGNLTPLTPPETSLDSPDWNPDDNPDDLVSETSEPSNDVNNPDELSKEELDRLRRRFEELL